MSFQSYVSFNRLFGGVFGSLHSFVAESVGIFLLDDFFLLVCATTISSEKNEKFPVLHLLCCERHEWNAISDSKRTIEQPLQSFCPCMKLNATFDCIMWFVCALDIFCLVLSQTL